MKILYCHSEPMKLGNFNFYPPSTTQQLISHLHFLSTHNPCSGAGSLHCGLFTLTTTEGRSIRMHVHNRELCTHACNAAIVLYSTLSVVWAVYTTHASMHDHAENNINNYRWECEKHVTMNIHNQVCNGVCKIIGFN